MLSYEDLRLKNRKPILLNYIFATNRCRAGTIVTNRQLVTLKCLKFIKPFFVRPALVGGAFVCSERLSVARMIS